MDAGENIGVGRDEEQSVAACVATESRCPIWRRGQFTVDE
jgi:hypothetical protein